MSTTHLDAGWYPDPDDPSRNRYWDGRIWTPGPPAASPAATSRSQEATLGEAVSRVSLAAAIAFGGLALVVIGSIGPWATTPLSSAAGTDGDGKIALVLAFVGLLFIIRAGVSRAFRAVGLLVLALGIYDAIHIHQKAARITLFGAQVVHVGWGVYLVIAGGVVMILAGMSRS